MTAASIQLDIAKMALQDANTRSSITALNDGSPEAVACQLYYGYVRDQALRASRWNFAKRSAILGMEGNAGNTRGDNFADYDRALGTHLSNATLDIFVCLAGRLPVCPPRDWTGYFIWAAGTADISI